ncbi:MAG: cellulase family glycosylhydrolase [Acidobacteriota bacterium]
MGSRREFLKTTTMFTLAAATSVQAGEPAEQLQNTQYQHIKGFNYVPSYAATIWEALELFDAGVWDREFGYSKQFHANALRIWCDYLSFQKDADRFLKSWEKALELAKKHDLKLMITTANRWVDALYPYGQIDLAVVLKGEPSAEYERYLKTFVGTFKDHPQVLMWDLCNEPFSGTKSKEEDRGLFRSLLKRQEMNFWRAVSEVVRSAKPSQPITVGIHSNHDLNPDEIHDIVDVISCHPYHGWWDGAQRFRDTCDYYIRVANRQKKPLICSETCSGSKSAETRNEIIRVSLGELEKRKIGWLAWQLMAGKAVSTRWDRTDQNCRPGDVAVMYWVEQDGKPRPGHEEKAWRTWN